MSHETINNHNAFIQSVADLIAAQDRSFMTVQVLDKAAQAAFSDRLCSILSL